MPGPLHASLVDWVLGLATAPAQPGAGNRLAVEGLAFGSGGDGTLEIRAARLHVASLQLVSGPLTVELGEMTLQQLSARVGVAGGRPRLHELTAAKAELSGIKVQGPLDLPRPAEGSRHGHGAPSTPPAASWCLAPLAAADGTLHAEIVDATLIFDADVRVPIRQGRVDFNEATVEHVGPDSRMGVSRLGLYVDAPNGRSYLLQFSHAPVAGVEYERRSLLPGPWGAQRGSLQLQAFGEALLREGPAAHGMGLTEQARLLLARTAIAGHVQLGDGKFATPALKADLEGRAAGQNVLRLKSQAVGRGLEIDLASLSVRNAAWSWGSLQLACDAIAGAVVLQLSVEGTQLRGALELPKMDLSGLSLRHLAAASAGRPLPAAG